MAFTTRFTVSVNHEIAVRCEARRSIECRVTSAATGRRRATFLPIVRRAEIAEVRIRKQLERERWL
jgi:hypothetical protein